MYYYEYFSYPISAYALYKRFTENKKISIRRLQQNRQKYDSCFNIRGTLLWSACEAGSFSIVLYLFQQGCTMAQLDEGINFFGFKKRCISTGSYDGTLPRFVSMIRQDPNLNNKQSTIWYPKSQYINIFKYLLHHGLENKQSADLILLWAIDKGHLFIVKYLVKIGYDPYCHNALALHMASSRGHLHIVKYLLKIANYAKSDIDQAFSFATQKHHKVAQYLQKYISQ